MGTISSQFCVTSIADGMTIHGSLWADATLTQALSGDGGVTPDWTGNGPNIYLTVLKGSQYVVPQSWTWYINGQEITDSDDRFRKGTAKVNNVDGTPKLQIIKNLASGGNVDIDVITITGNIESNGVPLTFSAGIEVRITRISGVGQYAAFRFPDGGSINESGEKIRIIPYFYEGIAEVQPSAFSVVWYINYDQRVTNTVDNGSTYYGTETYDGKSRPCLYLREKDVVDMTIVRCDFIKSGESDVCYTLTQNVDDEQDPDMMYVMYGDDSGLYDGNPASLHRNQSVAFKFWVATNDNPTKAEKNAEYTKYELMLLKADGTVKQTWTNVTADITVNGTTLKGGTCTLSYNTVEDAGGKITGLIKAT